MVIVISKQIENDSTIRVFKGTTFWFVVLVVYGDSLKMIQQFEFFQGSLFLSVKNVFQSKAYFQCLSRYSLFFKVELLQKN